MIKPTFRSGTVIASKPVEVVIEHEKDVRIFTECANGLLSIGEKTGHAFIDVTHKPMPTIQAGRPVKFFLIDEGKTKVKRKTEKPPYCVPSMRQIAKIEPNGFKIVSTFSGCGGSCLGFRMAGFKPLWASEFIEAARDSYKANSPEVTVDPRDIRDVTPEHILKQIGLERGELDVLEGSPPCSSFSTAGKRESTWGKVKKYSSTSQRTDDLFFEFIRVLDGLQPKVFVAENVSGLVKGVAKGYFLEVLAEMKKCGYRVSCRVLDAQWLGVPQTRARTIFVGVREDLGIEPAHPDPLPYRYSVRDALPEIAAFDVGAGFGAVTKVSAKHAPYPTVGVSPASGNGLATKVEAVIHDTGGTFARKEPITDKPCPAIAVGAGIAQTHYLVAGKGDKETKTGRSPDGVERRKFTIAELKRICGFPDDFVLTGTYAQQWERLGRSVPPVMMFHIAETIRDRILVKCAG